MYDTTDPRPPLPEWILECYTFLCEQEVDEDASSFSREQALDSLLEAQTLELEPEDVNHALTRLLERGYLYEVDDKLRVTTPSE
ncbi:hypothetical protein [Natronosalvus rutilus]|uniref:Uncharacterized protein n=1 Tax=Natronosalvus rutilus TaxID=2953753 RepID=A0A9E7NEZ4_9EURY|nr:hypothetical protein [Natronosalvus rutilus]UTF55823.1 hypothetical protein NGM29_19545 [Natronosalvus rutilus]